MPETRFIDVTLRDAHQCLWSTRMTTPMMMPFAHRMDDAGYAAVDLIGGAVWDVCVRYLREDPWERIRRVAGAVRRTPLNAWTRGASLFTFELFPDDVIALTIERLFVNGIRRLTCYDALNDLRNIEGSIRTARAVGLHVTAGVAYTISPVHTDEYFAGKARELVAMRIDEFILKDATGLLTPERVKTLIPALKAAVGPLPLQLHSHCRSGLAPICYLEAIRLGVDVVHTAISPLANGASLPATEAILRGAERFGHTTSLDPTVLAEQAKYFRELALTHGKPLGRVAEYDPMLYEHQVPGGMISNLEFQLRQCGIEHRLRAVLEEAGRVRKDLGYPVIVSPFAQFVITQSVLNVVQGERYKTIPDEIRRYALGWYGEPAGPMDPEFLDRAIGDQKPLRVRPGELIPPALDRLRQTRGPFRSDDDLLLAAYYSDEQLAPLRRREPPMEEPVPGRLPAAELLRELGRREAVRSVSVTGKGFALHAAW